MASGSLGLTRGTTTAAPYLIFRWTETSQVGLVNNFSWELEWVCGTDNFKSVRDNAKPGQGQAYGVEVTVAGQTYNYYDITGNLYYPTTTQVILSGTGSVTRELLSNETTLPVSLTMPPIHIVYNDNSYKEYNNYVTNSQTWKITSSTVPGEGAKITAVSDFNDETNPTITYLYDRPNGVASAKLEVCISWEDSVDNIPYREVSASETSYTFELTGTERSKLRELLDAGTTATVQFWIKTTETLTTGEITQAVFNGIPKTFSFINYKPVITPEVVDINSDTLRLTGDENTIVRHYSTAYFKTQAVARKGAHLTHQEVRNGDVTLSNTSTDSYEDSLEPITSNTFYFTATDNRGHTTNDAVIFNNLADKKWVEYIKLTTGIKHEPMNGEGELVVTISGKYFNGNFGIADNRFVLEYDIHTEEEAADNWRYVGDNEGVVQPSVTGEGDYTYEFTITGLDHTQVQQLRIRVADELMTVVTPITYVAPAESLFDWSQHDFNFNIPVSLTGGYMYPQWLLWGNPDTTEFSQLGEDDEIILDKPISSQPSGIVLVFSLYRDGVEDASIQSFFVSRTEVQYLLSSRPHLFMMGINSNMSIFGSKYVYISDNKLIGFSGNTASGTAACGITFDNSKFVLRYVIGV